jgi:hypothetical protein
MALDVPHIASSNYATSAYALNAGGLGSISNTMGLNLPTGTTAWPKQNIDDLQKVKRFILEQNTQHIKPVVSDMAEKTTSRFVRVIIVDPNENLPLEDRLVYKGEEKFTDLNDQELFFELEIKTLLATHNEKRTKTVDKTVKERTEHLEPAKIRDLKMVVVNIATF